jgi:Tol biopolymer transport system component
MAEGVEDVYLMDLSRGGLRAITSDGRTIGSYGWMPSGEELLIAVSRQNTAQSLWRVKLSDGSMRRMAEGGVGCQSPAASLKGGRIAWTTVVQDTNIWRLTLDGSAPDRAVIASTAADTNPQVSPDGRRLAFRSARTGFSEIWVSDIDGEHTRQLTFMNGTGTMSPRWSPDGRYLLFDSRASGSANLYKVAVTGGTPVRLMSNKYNQTAPSWSRDGRFIYFASDPNGRPQIFRMAADGGAPEALTNEGGGASYESADGFLYYTRGPRVLGLWRVLLRHAGEEAMIPALKQDVWGNWAVASTGIYFTRRTGTERPEHWQIAFLDFATGQTRVVRELPRQPVVYDNGLALSPDEKTLYFTLLDFSASDIYLLDGVR